jgi:hypothetical protein
MIRLKELAQSCILKGPIKGINLTDHWVETAAGRY